MWTKGHELKYWKRTGLKKGKYIYDNYHKVFDIKKYDLQDKTVADIGCGPFGGVFGNITNCNIILVDILAIEYNKMGKSNLKITYGDLSKKLPISTEVCDFVMCANTLDHISNMQHGLNELYRILKKNGILFLHIHLRTKKQINKVHIHNLSFEKVLQLTSKNFEITQSIADCDWVNTRPDRQAAYLTLRAKGINSNF